MERHYYEGRFGIMQNFVKNNRGEAFFVGSPVEKCFASTPVAQTCRTPLTDRELDPAQFQVKVLVANQSAPDGVCA